MPEIDDDTREILKSLLANTDEAVRLKLDALAKLDEAIPVLTAALRHHSGQSEKVRQILWSLYTCSHLVPLGTACSGLDTAIAHAVATAITARLLAGGEVEDRLQAVLTETGELVRCNEAEAAQALQGLPIQYPLPMECSKRLRELAEVVEAAEEPASDAAPVTAYKAFERQAVEAGVSVELAHAMYNVVRDSQEHDWMKPLKDWTGDVDAMISRALKNPTIMAESCTLLFATDGLMYDEGQVHAGISDLRRRELEAWIFNR